MHSASANFSQDPSSPILPLGTKVFWRFSGNLIIAETILGAITLILIAASEVPNPLLQGWVIFVAALFCICSFLQFILYVTRVPESIAEDWLLKDLVYYLLAFSCYLSASALQAYFCIAMSYTVTTGHVYGFNVAGVVRLRRKQKFVSNILYDSASSFKELVNNFKIFAFTVTLLYGISLIISLNKAKF